MEFDDVLINRTSTRAFKSEQISEEDIEKLLGNTISAPSAGNLQAYKIYIVQKNEVLNKLAKASWDQDFITEAPLSFVFCALPEESAPKYGNRGENLYSIQDASIAAAYCQLSATNLGLSSVWVGAFDDDEVCKVLELKNNEQPVAIIPIGQANEIPYPTSRKPIDKVVSWIK